MHPLSAGSLYCIFQQFELMKSDISKLIFGIVLVVVAVLLTSNPIYTFIKRLIVESGGSVVLAVAITWGLIGLSLVSGIVLLKQS